jgi:hypothetical protein
MSDFKIETKSNRVPKMSNNKDMHFYRHKIGSSITNQPTVVLIPVPEFTDEQMQKNISLYGSPYGVDNLIYMQGITVYVSHSSSVITVADAAIPEDVKRIGRGSSQ